MDLTKIFIEKMLYPYMEAKKGNRIRGNLEELKVTQFLSSEELRELQEKKLRRLLRRCIFTVPAYWDLGIEEEQILKDPFEALALFPPLTKAQLRNHPDDYISNEASPETLIPNMTGGSTGQPLKFYMDRHTVEYYEAARWRGLSWYGITPGTRSLMVWGNPVELDEFDQRKTAMREKYLKNRCILSAYALDPKYAKGYVKFIAAYKPKYLYGYAGALTALGQILINADLCLNPKFKAVVSTAETLTDEQRSIIKHAFTAKPVNEYGARDGGILAYECPEGGMHITAENCIIEILDPQTLKPVKTGENGLIAVTDLNNLSAPRLRYLIGDMGALSESACTCGRHLPLLKSISGREDALFKLPDGRLVHGNVINQLARESDTIQAIQLVQKSPEKAILTIVQDPGAEYYEDIYVDKVQKVLPGVEIEVRYEDEIPLSPSGKVRYAIREFPLSD